MNSKSLEAKRHFINGKTIIGIDPAKKKHQAVIIDSVGVLTGCFYFSRSYYSLTLSSDRMPVPSVSKSVLLQASVPGTICFSRSTAIIDVCL